MRKGMILEIDNEFVTVLTPEGEFLKARRHKRPYEIGSEILFTPFQPKKRNTFSLFYFSVKKISVICSVAAAIILLLSITPGRFDEKVSAYVTIDVNPSIELALDDELKVVDLKGLNPEGKEVIKDLSLGDKDIKAVAKEIVTATKKLGYFKNHKKIVVSTTLIEKNNQLEKNLRKHVTGITKMAALVSQATVKIVNATEKDRNKAKLEGISTGKYLEKKQAAKQKPNNAKQKPNNIKRKDSKENQKSSDTVKKEEKPVVKAKPKPQKPKNKKDVPPNKGKQQPNQIPEHAKPKQPDRDNTKIPKVPSTDNIKIPKVPIPKVPSTDNIKIPKVPTTDNIKIPPVPSLEESNKLQEKKNESKTPLQYKGKETIDVQIEIQLEIPKKPSLLREKQIGIFSY